MTDELLKENQEKLKTYKSHGFKEVALTCLSREHEQHQHPKKIITISEAEKQVKRLSKDGYSFMAVG